MDAQEGLEKALPSVGNWTTEQLKLAFNLYFQTPFGKLHRTNPEIVRLAQLIRRTPSALAMKLVNFASLDSLITDSGRKGLSGHRRLIARYGKNFIRTGKASRSNAQSYGNSLLMGSPSRRVACATNRRMT